MKIPEECKMRDLSGLSQLSINFTISCTFGPIQIDKSAAPYIKNYVRILDAALCEYQRARECILLQIDEANRPSEKMTQTGRILYIHKFPTHMEFCINSIARIFKLIERLKNNSAAPSISREKRKLIESISSNLIYTRNAIEHMDERIHDGLSETNAPIAIVITDDGNSIAVDNRTIRFSDLALTLEKLHKIAVESFLTPYPS